MTVERDPHAAKILMGLWFRRKETTSAKLYFPRFLNGSAINKRIMGQPIKKPIEYISPSNPVKYTSPEMPKKDAADKARLKTLIFGLDIVLKEPIELK